jgi:nicotinate-nucleotide adenylyltransferase
LAGARRVVVFGGSFDPVHRWHAAVAGAAKRRVGVAGKGAWVVFVPAARSPHKEDGPRAGDEDRVEMLRRATGRMKRAVVWTDEMDRAAAANGEVPSYTVDTLRRLRRGLSKDAKVWLLMGADQAEKFHLWREYREVMRLASPLVVLRPPMRSADGLVRAMRSTGAWTEEELSQWGRRVVKCAVRAVSSTEVRAAAARGNGKKLRTMVSPGVAAWIEGRGLYRKPAGARRGSG